MKTILIDPYLQRIDEVEIDDELAIIKHLIDAELLDAVPWYIEGKKFALWVDDEGINNDKKPWLRTKAQTIPVVDPPIKLGSLVFEPVGSLEIRLESIYGRGLLIGCTSNGVHCDTTIDVLKVAEFVSWELP